MKQRAKRRSIARSRRTALVHLVRNLDGRDRDEVLKFGAFLRDQHARRDLTKYREYIDPNLRLSDEAFNAFNNHVR